MRQRHRSFMVGAFLALLGKMEAETGQTSTPRYTGGVVRRSQKKRRLIARRRNLVQG